MITPWKILKTTYLQPGIRVDHCELPDGQNLNCQLLEYADEIMIFALTKKQEAVVIKQYRHGVQQAILEFPGGSVDDGERPMEAAKRELMEETGYASERWIEIGRASPNPAIYTNKIYSFLTLDAVPTGKQSNHEAEFIEVSLISLEEIVAMAKRGDLIHSLNLSTLFFVLNFLNRVS
jgi:ADP-ribose pyrophosphatase